MFFESYLACLFFRFLEALFSVLKVVIGTGIFAFPMAFKYTGLIVGIVLTIAMTFVLVYGIHLLVYYIFHLYISHIPIIHWIPGQLYGLGIDTQQSGLHVVSRNNGVCP